MPVDPAVATITAQLVRGIDGESPIIEDVSESFEVGAATAKASISVDSLGRSFLSVNVDVEGDGVADDFDSVAIERLDPASEACRDSDGDRIADLDDNCPTTYDPMHVDGDGDGIGDVCEGPNRSLSLQTGDQVTTKTILDVWGTSSDRSGSVVVLGGASPARASFSPGTFFQFRAQVLLKPNQVNTLSVFQVSPGGQTYSEVITVEQVATGTERVAGVVSDEAGAPIEGVSVSVGSVSIQSDVGGFYDLAGLGENRVVVLFEKAGFLSHEVLVRPTDSGEAGSGASAVTLVAEDIANSTTGPQGGVLTTPAGYELVVPPGALAAGQEVRMTELQPPAGAPPGLGNPYVDLTPSQEFLKPVTLRMPNLFGSVAPSEGILLVMNSPGPGADLIVPAIATADGQFLEVEMLNVDGGSSGYDGYIHWTVQEIDPGEDSYDVTQGAGSVTADQIGHNVTKEERFSLCDAAYIASVKWIPPQATFDCEEVRIGSPTAQPCETVSYTKKVKEWRMIYRIAYIPVSFPWWTTNQNPLLQFDFEGSRQANPFYNPVVSSPMECQ